VDAADLRAYLRERLPQAMVPATVVILDALPRTPNGKIDRRALPAPSSPRADALKRAAPANEVEAKIAAVWKELLDLDEIGVDESFFDLGANSLLMMRSVGKLSAALNKSLALIDLLRFTTIRSLAAHVGTARREPPLHEGARRRAQDRWRALERQRQVRSHR
jgi:acyl carrier protein